MEARKETQRVLVGMSGGVDSSAVCLMLLEQGYEVLGVTMRTWDAAPAGDAAEPAYVAEARRLAERLGIPHYVADEREAFKEQIVEGYFIREYLRGRTPNPCVVCNPLFKFRVLAEWADRLGCPFIATGHYSVIERCNGLCYVAEGEDLLKDQSYFLWRLGQDVLARCLFPLGKMTKQQVREYLARKGFEAKSREGESMEICFIQGDYRDFLREQVPDLDERIGKGWFVDAAGVKLGEHKGYPYYTIGQRKGLEIALGRPAYVLKINPEKNTVMLGDAARLKASHMLVEDVRWVAPWDESLDARLAVRIRYRSRPVPCRVRRLDDGRWLVHFLGEASAVTPGQSAVFYDGRRVVGGAFIASQRGIGMYLDK